jgi:membrane-bound inhibitor of C-type lysozyme
MNTFSHIRAIVWVLATATILFAAATAAAEAFTTYRCRDGSEFVAAFYDGDRRAHLQLDGKAIALAKRPAIKGSRYVKGDITLRFDRNGVPTLERGRRTTDCAVY